MLGIFRENNKFYKINIIESIKNNDLSTLKILLEKNSIDINTSEFYGVSLLYYSVLFKKINVTQFLLENKANPLLFNKKEIKDDNEVNIICKYFYNINTNNMKEDDAVNRYSKFLSEHSENNSLFFALYHDSAIFNIIINNIKLDENIKREFEEELFLLVLNRNIEIIELLLPFNLNIYKKLYCAYFKRNSYSILRKYDKLTSGQSILEILKEKNNEKLFDIFLKHYENDLYFLEFLFKQNYKKEFIEKKREEIYKKNPNQNFNGYTLIYQAIENKNIEQIKLLLESKVDFELKNEKYSQDIYDLVASKNNLEILNLLIKYNIHKNKVIIALLNKNHMENVINIISDIEDLSTFTILYHAVRKENVELIKLILQKKANPNFITGNNKYKQIPLHIACELQNFNIIKLLIENGADTNLQNHEGKTALFEAIEVKKANKDIIRYLIQNGADIYKEDNKGITPLSFAENIKKSLVKVLLEAENNKYNDDKLQISNINEIKKEKEQQKYIESLLEKIEKLEELSKNKPSSKSEKKPLIMPIQIEKRTINKTDGELIKRDSFDDF